jgi:hypothetical protein
MTESFNLKRADQGPPLQKIIAFVATELAVNHSDVIHDFLAYLAEQMIEMNKKKNEEIKGFLKWIEREIGAEVEALTNKTAIKEYHDHSFDNLLDILKKNKTKLTIDPANRKIQESMEKSFGESMAVLHPLKEKIRATDTLTDQIVYRLYGLTPEEVEIVEGKR